MNTPKSKAEFLRRAKASGKIRSVPMREVTQAMREEYKHHLFQQLEEQNANPFLSDCGNIVYCDSSQYWRLPKVVTTITRAVKVRSADIVFSDDDGNTSRGTISDYKLVNGGLECEGSLYRHELVE